VKTDLTQESESVGIPTNPSISRLWRRQLAVGLRVCLCCRLILIDQFSSVMASLGDASMS
jgi:hypothetical protein